MSRTGKRYWHRLFGGFVVMCLLCVLQLNIVWAEELTGYSSEEIVEQMGIGWNLGNTFDATGGNAQDVFSQEQSWGNPIVTKELIDAVKEAGFTTIRIPVTWYKHLSSDGSYTIDQDFLDRVKTVVDYAYEDGLFIILNLHHEAWLNVPELAADYETLGEELGCIWKQLAETFAGYDQHLIFEGMNEPRMAGSDIEWTGSSEAYAAVNYLNQVFVNVVRHSEKGYNQERCLMIPGYAASSSASILSSIAVPTANGEAVQNLIISVHCYSPYDFCLSDNRKTFDPDDPNCTGEIDTLFHNLQSMFLDNGIPVVIGETSATNQNNTSEREKWAAYMAEKSAAYGVPIVIWDNGANGSSGGENHAYINRKTNEWNYPTVIQALMDGIESVKWGSGREEKADAVESLLGGSVLWNDAEGLTSTKQWDSSYIVLSANEGYYAEGREIAIVYSGSGEPRMVLDSAEKSAWWIPVEPSRIEKLDAGKKAAYFTYDDMLREMKKAGVDQFSQLRNMSFFTVNANITSYEVCIVGGEPSVTYLVNGRTYYVGTQLPKEPSFTNMQFDGWYTTKNYQAGSEYNGETPDADITVYAKFLLTLDVDALGGTEKPDVPPEEAETKPEASEPDETEKEPPIEAEKTTEETKPEETEAEETKPEETKSEETEAEETKPEETKSEETEAEETKPEETKPEETEAEETKPEETSAEETKAEETENQTAESTDDSSAETGQGRFFDGQMLALLIFVAAAIIAIGSISIVLWKRKA